MADQTDENREMHVPSTEDRVLLQHRVDGLDIDWISRNSSYHWPAGAIKKRIGELMATFQAPTERHLLAYAVARGWVMGPPWMKLYLDAQIAAHKAAAQKLQSTDQPDGERVELPVFDVTISHPDLEPDAEVAILHEPPEVTESTTLVLTASMLPMEELGGDSTGMAVKRPGQQSYWPRTGHEPEYRRLTADELVQRQNFVLQQAAEGLGVEKIAKMLSVSESTVGGDIRHARKRLGDQRTRLGAILAACRAGDVTITLHDKQKAKPAEDCLAEQQLKVLQRIALDMSNQEIASKLEITVKTVKSHVAAINKRLKRITNETIGNREEAVLCAIRWRVIELPNQP